MLLTEQDMVHALMWPCVKRCACFLARISQQGVHHLVHPGQLVNEGASRSGNADASIDSYRSCWRNLSSDSMATAGYVRSAVKRLEKSHPTIGDVTHEPSIKTTVLVAPFRLVRTF